MRRRTMSSGYVTDCANNPATPPKSSRRPTGISESSEELFFVVKPSRCAFLSKAPRRVSAYLLLSVSKVAKDMPAYGTMPSSVGVMPPYSPLRPSLRNTAARSRNRRRRDVFAFAFAAVFKSAPFPADSKTNPGTAPAAAYRARIRSNGYVIAVAVAPAADPARNLVATEEEVLFSLSFSKEAKESRASEKKPLKAASYRGYAANDTPA
mmetsp:Transcript_13018/g.54669  ORF Transcript_13018/g.54669 Transcript_13018/m.54669 type:complete len:209 (-) Transcript_13018:1474-2100(-)